MNDKTRNPKALHTGRENITCSQNIFTLWISLKVPLKSLLKWPECNTSRKTVRTILDMLSKYWKKTSKNELDALFYPKQHSRQNKMQYYFFKYKYVHKCIGKQGSLININWSVLIFCHTEIAVYISIIFQSGC